MNLPVKVLMIRFSDWHSISAMAFDLPVEEQTRAGAFRNDAARDRFVICRWVLRDVLRQMGIRRWQAPFFYRNGKPYLLDGPQFSISHTGTWGVIAVSEVAPIGIDIEEVKQRTNPLALAKHVFSPEEIAALSKRVAASPGPTAPSVLFYTIWTRKEAVVKAVAGSIYRATDLTVLPPHTAWGLVFWNQKSLWLRDLPAPDGHRMAVAVSAM